MKVLGLSCFYHDSAVAAIEDGQIRFAIHEERLSREKHDPRFPIMAVTKALQHCQWSIDDVDGVAFYERPSLKLRRICDQIVHDWPSSWTLFSEYFPYFYKFKYPIEEKIREALRYKGPIRLFEHHYSHAASSFFTSPFERALILTIDGVGEFDTTGVFLGEEGRIKKLASIHFPDSLGLFYSVFTQYLGFAVNEGEYKVMGLAPYGEPKFIDAILNHVIHLHDDGSYSLNRKFFNFSDRNRHFTPALIERIGLKPRSRNDEMTQPYMNLAASVQRVLELAIHHMLKRWVDELSIDSVCLAGGVALNCTANAQMIRDLGVSIHIHPAAGDAGGAMGAAMALENELQPDKKPKYFFTPYLGVVTSGKVIETTLKINKVPYRKSENCARDIAKRLVEGDVVAVFHGRDEWGPRALGNRSILGDPRKAEMKEHLNAKIKFREEFRPFAPICMEEHYGEYFETLGMDRSPYMLFTHQVKKPEVIPAVVHVDQTSRVQTVSEEQNPYIYSILKEFYAMTGVPVLINTSFNLRGEPVVGSPSDSLKTFFASGIDHLALEDFLVSKTPS